MTERIKSFTDLRAWQLAHRLTLDVYLCTNRFPPEEKFGLVNQVRRSAVSVPSNIAEGFSRNTSKDKQQFYSIALGSLSELQAQLLLARDLTYLDNTTFDTLAEATVIVNKVLHGLRKALD